MWDGGVRYLDGRQKPPWVVAKVEWHPGELCPRVGLHRRQPGAGRAHRRLLQRNVDNPHPLGITGPLAFLGYQQLQAAISGLHPELEEAGRIFGATRFGSLWRITAPLLRTSLIATWCFVFIGVIRELWATIVLRWVGGQPPFPIGAVVVASARIRTFALTETAMT